MANFPNHQQLQKNALLTLCSDRILQDVTFDRFKCTSLVMDTLVGFKETSMNRMAVAIASILASKISTSETSFLGARPMYMETLLDIVQRRVHMTVDHDIMLKFTLSALWNLTDESPTTCTMFLEKRGMSLYLEVLKHYEGHSAVETKVLGLLNNIAEVPILRKRLIEDEFITTLRSLLRSPQIDVSYFAAGIFAHIISDGFPTWEACCSIAREDVLKDLAEAVLNWKTPELEMVAYRSFSPFLPLLECYETPEVQLWAVWAIHHVCSKNPKRYCEMLVEEDTLRLFQEVISAANSDQNRPLLDICQQTLNVIRLEFPYLREQT
jgi:Zyg-11 family protein